MARGGRARLTRAGRRDQLLTTATRIRQEEGADRLTLGRLAERAGVSKPVVYDHFHALEDLQIALYRTLHEQQLDAVRAALTQGEARPGSTIDALAEAYIRCAADVDADWRALSGSAQKDAVFQELLDSCVDLFVDVLGPRAEVPSAELRRRCTGLVGAGEALAAACVRGECRTSDGARSLAALMQGALAPGGRRGDG
ncbi:TetR/AcrR family transcriptional regulator [Georgenia sp. Z1344]|uniref:TetR/AcrR family transcriptional regulator n=1 Tax=Georgenia sp. Z1344 TaxID=3416706 RepID=UPI003CE87036